MLAGGAPLHAERLGARGGPAGRSTTRNLFYDTSSFGARALDAIVRAVGIDQLVYGSDRPVIEPPSPELLGEAAPRRCSAPTSPAARRGARARGGGGMIARPPAAT